MKIGLDFDGVITDCGKLKSEGAKKLFDINIPPGRFKKEFIINKGILTKEQYKELQSQIYDTKELGLLMEPVDDVLIYLPKLKNEKHDIKIITSRLESQIIKEWMKKRKLSLTIINVGYDKDKTEACKGLDIYIDDDLDKLEPLVKIVPYRFLFTWDYNKHIKVDPSIAQRVNSWKQLYEKIQKINYKI